MINDVILDCWNIYFFQNNITFKIFSKQHAWITILQTASVIYNTPLIAVIYRLFSKFGVFTIIQICIMRIHNCSQQVEKIYFTMSKKLMDIVKRNTEIIQEYDCNVTVMFTDINILEE